MVDDSVHVLLPLKFSKDILARIEGISPRIKLHIHPAKQISDIPSRILKMADVYYCLNIVPQAGTEHKIKWIQSHFAGVDVLLQHPFIQENPDIIITSTRGIHATVIGEYVIGMMLALGHHLPQILKDQQTQTWAEDRHTRYVPVEIRNATIGILGYGNIGREIARLCKAFGAKVLATKRDLRDLDQDGYILSGTGDPTGDLCDRLYPPQATKTMLKECDFVVITLPITVETRGFFGEDMLAAMKPGAFLINIGRGGIVDEMALVSALEEQHLAGAAMDVFAVEPLPSNHPLWNAPNFILTPHLAGNTLDYNEKAAEVFIDNLRRFLEGRPLQNIVDRNLGY